MHFGSTSPATSLAGHRSASGSALNRPRQQAIELLRDVWRMRELYSHCFQALHHQGLNVHWWAVLKHLGAEAPQRGESAVQVMSPALGTNALISGDQVIEIQLPMAAECLEGWCRFETFPRLPSQRIPNSHVPIRCQRASDSSSLFRKTAPVLAWSSPLATDSGRTHSAFLKWHETRTTSTTQTNLKSR